MGVAKSVVNEQADILATHKEKRPWGSFELFIENTSATVKILKIRPQKKLSLQYHMLRDEFWKVIDGECFVVIGGGQMFAKKGDEFFIRRGVEHRIETGKFPVEILEISLGEFNEDDIVRVEDEYGRV